MNISKWIITSILRVYFRLTIRMDADELKKVPMQGPLIVISNHTGQIEVPVLATLLQPRKISGWGKAEAFDNLFLRWVFGAWDIIPVRRGEADMKALKDALRALENGYIFGIAPEGTRNKTGRLLRAHPGAVILALRSGAPILPVAHWGGEVFLKNLKRFKRTDFHVRVGEPFRLKVEGLKVTAEMRQEIVDEMMVRIASMLPEEYRGEYSDINKYSQKFLTQVATFQ
ncbi:MAG: 1-acyl-sn-glycerol-3-phosphate acyltransferase [Chloroflexi bacterium]|nr:1-acyl-sn-glycerol-3-phosphate acyltransferase [Chloroflexota bacterium]MDL1941831.1 1-acyl-sn-glycerol-3-phosphate acyltransferase [Chloroflexi bacterium CFX2]